MTTYDPQSGAGWRTDRQAVVIIHGIGEQRPMQTLRGFADAILGVTKGGASRFYNKPDMLSDTFELRKLVSHRGRPRTDFFELYWAHRMPIATWSRIAAWFQTLMLRPRADLEPQIRPIWWMCWLPSAEVGCRPVGLAAGHRGDVGQGEAVELVADAAADAGPHRQQHALALVVARAVLVGLPEVAQGDGAVDRRHDLAEGDEARLSGEDVPAADAALGPDDARALERQQDLLEVGLRQPGPLGDVAHRRGP